jgi:hypothetical protein
MNLYLHAGSDRIFVAAVGLAALLLFGSQTGSAQPTIVSTVPPDSAGGVSASAAVVFTFSEPMDTAQTSVQFVTSAFTTLTATEAWSAGNTVLTCTPTPAFPAGTNIFWVVTGQNVAGMSLSGTPTGFFRTAGGSGGGGGSGTNAITTFTIGKTYLYQQFTAGLPTLLTNESYTFIATTSLSSNRTANTITVAPPSGGVSNLLQDIVAPEDYTLFAFDTNNARFEAAFPEGNYVFKVTASSSNQQVTATLPLSMVQPNAPHISNWAAAQSLNVAQAFTLTWDVFQGGTASDVIFLTVGNNVFQSGRPGTSNVLSGTATSVTIPANTLAANSNYVADLGFYHIAGTSNATYSAGGYRLTATQFHINTTGTASKTPLVSNPLWSGGGFSFDVATSPAEVLKVLFSTDCSLPLSQWLTLLETNSTGTSVHITVPPQPGQTGFIRIQN